MINHRKELGFGEDAASVLLQFRGRVNATPNGTAGIDLRLHVVCSTDTAVVAHPEGGVLVNSRTLQEGGGGVSNTGECYTICISKKNDYN